MIRKNEISRQKLFDGDEEKALKEIFEIENKKIKLIDFYNSPLRELKKEITEENFNLIIKESQLVLKNSFIETYISEEGLEVNYLKVNDVIYVFSFGEYQPARYMIFLEGIWEI